MQKFNVGKRASFCKSTDMLYILMQIGNLPQGSIGAMGL